MSTDTKQEIGGLEGPVSSTSSKGGKALVFVSHDSRDAAIAEAFSKLLSSVSAGVLKSFRSSDKKGTQGIEYGVDWYPEVMRKLDDASDVVCLLTPYSVGRPWILYEAGVAKGQLNTPVHGLALGIPLAEASTGPFAQFQNSDDDTDSMTSLVMQLVSRIPNAEPDREVVVSQVEAFNAKVTDLISKQGHEKEKPKKVDDSPVAKLFEEIKLMYQDLPTRIESRIADIPVRRTRQGRFSSSMLEDITMGGDPDLALPSLVIWLGIYKGELPVLYDLAYDMYQADALGDINRFIRLSHVLASTAGAMRQTPIMETFYNSKELYNVVHNLPMILERILHRARRRREQPDGQPEARLSSERS